MTRDEVERNFLTTSPFDLVDQSIRETILDLIYRYENSWGGQFYLQDFRSIQSLIDNECSKTKLYPALKFEAIRQYLLACNQPEAILLSERISLPWIDSVRNTMLRSPTHLKVVLDSIFYLSSEDGKSSDVIYRAFCWLTYMGILEEDIDELTSSSVDLHEMKVKDRNGMSYHIYSEAVRSLRICSTENSLKYVHSKYTANIQRINNGEDERLLRGVKSDVKIKSCKSSLNRAISNALSRGEKVPDLTYTEIRNSGIFYRAYERELMEVPINFLYEVTQEFGSKYEKYEEADKKKKTARQEKSLRDKYVQWKIAFKLI